MIESQSSVFKILIATDIHLGFKESHEIRGNDSFKAFQQILNYSEQLSPDILLLGGDLFDTINPSQTCIYKCLRMLQQSVFGDKDIAFDHLSKNANFLNQNLNIKLPIFTIHGNHDVPMQYGKSICDLLQACNYVNYFGNFPNTNAVHLVPLKFEKNGTKVAIYGLGYIHPFRLSRLFKDKKITYEEPPEDSYNIIIIHQNRYKGKTTGADYEECLHPQLLPEWIDLIIWCHQHESIPKFTMEEGRKVYQPGSTISTSLTEGEGIKKHIGLLEITKRKCELTPYFLNSSYRPIIIIDIDLEDLIDIRKDELNDIIVKRVQEEMEDKMKRLLVQEQKTNIELPLLRVKLQTTEKYQPKILDLQKHFIGKVANKNEVFKAKKKKVKLDMKRQSNLIMQDSNRKSSFSFNIQQYQDLQSQCRSRLKKNIRSFPFIIQKSAEVQQILEIELSKVGERGKGFKAFQKLMEDSSADLIEAGKEELKGWNQMMNNKYSQALKINKAIVLRNLKNESWSEEYEKEIQKDMENLMTEAEYQAMWDTRIKKIDNLTLESMMEDERYKRKETAALNQQEIKQEFIEEESSIQYKKPEPHKNNNLNDIVHHSHHHSHGEFEEEKCCPKEGVQFDEQAESRFFEIEQIVTNENKGKKENKKGTKKQNKSQGRQKERSQGRSKGKGSARKKQFI